MEDNNNKPEKDENAFEDPINKALSDPETPLSSRPPVDRASLAHQELTYLC